ncbi:MAG: hypothetical protein WC229_02415 [Candidatus Paceibacterota bacterium]|jgi:hypothetical protein
MKIKLIILSLSLILSGTIISKALAGQNGGDDNRNTSTSWTNDDDRDGDRNSTSSREEDDDRFSTSTATSTREDNKIGEEHRSEIANFIKSLLKVADRNEGIGEKVRVMAREQASSSDKVAEAINTIEKRSNLKTFLIGTDYKNIGKIRSEIAQTRNKIDELNKDLAKLSTSTDKTTIENEMKSLETSQEKIEDFMKKNESRFSLFGWFVKLFQ